VVELDSQLRIQRFAGIQGVVFIREVRLGEIPFAGEVWAKQTRIEAPDFYVISDPMSTKSPSMPDLRAGASPPS
jgi:hypothetical protein